ncbi:MAG: hypothetical protein LBM92_01625, partial [Opitutaceae bacterium]|nr:hypothetical protein [Opitutaceae bacterium]
KERGGGWQNPKNEIAPRRRKTRGRKQGKVPASPSLPVSHSFSFSLSFPFSFSFFRATKGSLEKRHSQPAKPTANERQWTRINPESYEGQCVILFSLASIRVHSRLKK